MPRYYDPYSIGGYGGYYDLYDPSAIYTKTEKVDKPKTTADYIKYGLLALAGAGLGYYFWDTIEGMTWGNEVNPGVRVWGFGMPWQHEQVGEAVEFWNSRNPGFVEDFGEQNQLDIVFDSNPYTNSLGYTYLDGENQIYIKTIHPLTQGFQIGDTLTHTVMHELYHEVHTPENLVRNIYYADDNPYAPDIVGSQGGLLLLSDGSRSDFFTEIAAEYAALTDRGIIQGESAYQSGLNDFLVTVVDLLGDSNIDRVSIEMYITRTLPDTMIAMTMQEDGFGYLVESIANYVQTQNPSSNIKDRAYEELKNELIELVLKHENVFSN